MKEQIKTLNGPKNFSDSDICRNEERGNSASQEKKMVKLTGTFTSRIETRDKNNQPYHYGFFKISEQTQEIPVIFKWSGRLSELEPAIPKGSRVELTGNWAQSNNSRPSFTCQTYQLLKDPPTIKINCFYNSKYSPCLFTTPESQLMEKHYRQKHYAKAKEVFHG